MDKLQGEKPRIITLCGSTKFKDEINRANAELTMQGNLVISLGVFGHVDMPDHDWTTNGNADKLMLDNLHKRKIDLADEIMVIDVDGYVGESTRGEIAYAEEKGKPVRYWSRQSGRIDHAFRSMNGDDRCCAIVGQLPDKIGCGRPASEHNRSYGVFTETHIPHCPARYDETQPCIGGCTHNTQKSHSGASEPEVKSAFADRPTTSGHYWRNGRWEDAEGRPADGPKDYDTGQMLCPAGFPVRNDRGALRHADGSICGVVTTTGHGQQEARR